MLTRCGVTALTSRTCVLAWSLWISALPFKGPAFEYLMPLWPDKGVVMGLVAPGMGERGRGYMDRLDKVVVRRRIGAGGLIYVRLPASGTTPTCSVKVNVLPRSGS